MFFPVPDFKGFDFFPHNLRIPFMRYKGVCFALSLIFMAGSLGLYFTKGLNYGVDFVGGSLIEVQHKNGPAPLSEMREKLNALGIGSVQIQSFGSDTDVLIRVEQQKGGEAEQQVAMKKVIDTLGPEYTQRRIEVVGPAVSSELRRTGLIAVFASIIAIIIYVWFRFEWQFAAGTVVALLHDVLVTIGVFSLLGLEFDLSIVAALLTILGYSVNDSVVVSDRIRENLRKFKRMDLNDLLNLSINETLSRTILTGMTAIAGIMALLVFGGEVIRNFSFAMLFGIIIGTYSSMFIAAPLLGYLGVKRDTVGSAPKPADAGPVIAPATSGGADRANKAARSGGRQVPNKAAR
ncbi:Sec translocon accessory complex subunit SecF [Hyphomicrobium sp. 1Nfss2.1]|uniref:protein translocase subunit SecF n=1 Tax=Hyphomicrobium sp. 1Nfss2.1 TaxID=3413936 RepID=UPI003C7D7501